MMALGSTPREPRQSCADNRLCSLRRLSRFGCKADRMPALLQSIAWTCALMMLVCHLVCPATLMAQNVSIGTATANNSALLHLESTSKGFLMPRVTNTQMLAISSPATSDIVWNSTYTNYYYYTGSYWTPLSGSGWALTGDAGTSASTNFLGTKDSIDVVQKTNARERLRFTDPPARDQ